MESMQEFIDAFYYQLDEMARHVVQNNNYLGRALEKVRSSSFLSGLFIGLTNTSGSNKANFRDVAAGGAKYNSAGIAIIGLADVIDSFCVIDELIFGGKIKADELIKALASDFSSESTDTKEESPQWLSVINRIRKLFQAQGNTGDTERLS